ncbi:hypothetical protein PV327_004220 [Microctonus hyperodae]|uniref:Cytochrome P450 n=1 Tax=Microctonus hyperodae TaxID=165561 RepID=A0AA39FC32_MICHY|nr:hypothetical protein PV327_004220 [Microctonus hyperodae]
MDIFYLLLSTILCILLYIIYRYLTRNQDYWEKLGVPTIRNSVPYFGYTWPILMQRKCSGEIYHEIYESNPNCSMIGIYNCGEPELYIRDPDLIKAVMQTNFSNFQVNGLEFNLELDPLLKLNPFVNVGEKWKNGRAALTNTMSASKLKNMSLTIKVVSEKYLKYLNKNVKQNNNTWETDVQALFARFTAEVVAGVGFGVDGECFVKDTGTFVDMGNKIFEPTKLNALKQFITLFVPSLAKILGTGFLPREFDFYCRRVVSDVLKSRKQTGLRGNDFIQHICDLYKSENGEIDEDFVTCHATSFYIDGYLTSSYTLSRVAYHLSIYPDVQNKLRDEIKEILGKHQGSLTYDAIQDMKYLDLVIKESMRMSPVVSSLQKVCTTEFKFVGYDGVEYLMKPGSKVIMCPSAIHLDSKYWDNPEDFIPERFDDEHKNEFHKFTYLSFGAGPRLCVGMRMAMTQMKFAIVTLIDNFSITLSSKTKVPFTFDPVGILNIPKGGIWLNIKAL